MMKYPKIHTIWERDERGLIKEGKICKPEFDQVQYYLIQEKIDGTNIRIHWEENAMIVEFGGRSDDALMPAPLLRLLMETFTIEKMEEMFKGRGKSVTLFGEGYGGKIQSGKKYTETEKFILFDAWVDGWWLEDSALLEIATKLGIRVVPNYGIMTKEEAILVVKAKPNSSLNPNTIIEGIVAKSSPMVLFRDGTPIYWKLKCKDYDKLKNRADNLKKERGRGARSSSQAS